MSPAEASALRREAIEYLREARALAPWALAFGRALGDLFRAEAETRRALKDSAGSTAALEQANAICLALARENPGVPALQAEIVAGFHQLSEALRSSGRLAELERHMDRFRDVVEGLPRGSAENLYQAACILASGAGQGATTRSGGPMATQTETPLQALERCERPWPRDFVTLSG